MKTQEQSFSQGHYGGLLWQEQAEQMISDFARDGRLAPLPTAGQPPPLPAATAALLASPRLFLYVALQDAHAPLQAPQVRKRIFCSRFLHETIILPGQAGDKHRGNSKTTVFSQEFIDRCRQVCDAQRRSLCAQIALVDEATRKKTRIFAPFYTNNDHFTKTGSGQT